jgi:spectinomycin phosphotransferase
MLEKPALSDEKISACLQAEYGLPVTRVTFLPVGADRNTAVYRVVTDDGTPYFFKLRSGLFDETSVALPKFLRGQGLLQIIAPLETKTGQLWTNLETFKGILYPFVAGRDGYEVDLTDRQWIDLGKALKHIHTLEIPAALISLIHRETYSSYWREIVKMFQERVEQDTFDDPLAEELAAFLKTKRGVVLDLVERTGRLANSLQDDPEEFTLCHSDIHAGNVLINANGALYIVDWDAPLLAPKERDLMSIGAGLFGAWRTPSEEESLFYRGYGETRINPLALAYYRYERIVEDLAVDSELIFRSNEGGEDREKSLGYLTSNFLPGNTIEIAYQADKTLRE